MEKTVAVPVLNYVDFNIPLDYCVPTKYGIYHETPVAKETIVRRPVEYVITKDNPVPQETLIEIAVPQVQKRVTERVVERPVTIERIVQVPRAREEIVEIEVPREIERACYVQKVIEKEVVYDQVIEEKYEVIVPNVIELQIEKEIQLPKKTIS